MRCFISIDIPENIKKEIKKIQEKLPEFSGKKIEGNNLHLTLKFLGEVSEEKIELVKEKLKKVKIAEFETEINSIGVFSGPKGVSSGEEVIRIVWLNLTNCDGLQKEIDSSLKGLFEPEQRFMGHLTIARVKKLKNKKEFLNQINKIKIPKIKFSVDNFKLKNSVLKTEGPVYEDIEEYKLE